MSNIFQIDLPNGATILHVNIRKEGQDDNLTPAVDIKMLAEDIDGDILESIIGGEPGYWRTLWDLTDISHTSSLKEAIETISCNPKFLLLGECKADITLEGRHDLVISSHTVRPSKIGKFSFICKPEMKIDLTFSISISNPPTELTELFIECLKEALPLSIIPDDDLFDGAG